MTRLQTRAAASRYWQLYTAARWFMLALFAAAVINIIYVPLRGRAFAMAPLLPSSLPLLEMCEAGVSAPDFAAGLLMQAVFNAVFLLAFLLGRRLRGWMVAGTIVYGIDTLFSFGYFMFTGSEAGWALPAVLQGGGILIIHAACLTLFVLALTKCRVAPISPAAAAAEEAKAQANPAGVVPDSSETGFYTAECGTRTLTLTRKKSFLGSAVRFIVTVNSREAGDLPKNGAVLTMEVPAGEFRLGCLTKTGVRTEIPVPAGSEPPAFEVSMRMGAVANDFVFRKM